MQPIDITLARPAGLEPATYGFEARRSIQLSYGRYLQQNLSEKPGFVNKIFKRNALTYIRNFLKYTLFIAFEAGIIL